MDQHKHSEKWVQLINLSFIPTAKSYEKHVHKSFICILICPMKTAAAFMAHMCTSKTSELSKVYKIW